MLTTPTPDFTLAHAHDLTHHAKEHLFGRVPRLTAATIHASPNGVPTGTHARRSASDLPRRSGHELTRDHGRAGEVPPRLLADLLRARQAVSRPHHGHEGVVWPDGVASSG